MWKSDASSIIDASWFYIGYDVLVNIGFTSNRLSYKNTPTQSTFEKVD
jgi:hypothetical protein